MPSISVIVPCYNEEGTINFLLEAIYNQTFPHNSLEVILADGRSTDNTRTEIEEFNNNHPDLVVTIIDNPKRNIPAGLNLAFRASKGDIIVRLDAHSFPEEDYIQRCVEDLQAGKGQNVGGIWRIRPRNPGWQARVIAKAAAHPLGVGDARYRIGGDAQNVDTVPFGAFRRDTLEKVGLYNESLLSNEDYELNTRIRLTGGTIWFNPAIQSTYLAAGSFKALGRQYWRYGYWKAQMIKIFPGSLRLRQIIPPIFVLSLFGFFLAGFFWHPLWWLLMIELTGYLSIMLIMSLGITMKSRDPIDLFGIPIAFSTMHISWGTAFLYGFLRQVKKNG